MARWQWRDLGARPLFFPAAALAAGAACGVRTAGPPGLFLAATAAIFLASFGLTRRPGAHLLALVGFALAGLTLAKLQAGVGLPPSLAQGGQHRLEADIVGVQPRPDGLAYLLNVQRVEDGTWVQFKARLVDHGSSRLDLTPGQRVLVRATLKPPPPPLNWGEADFAAPLARQGIAFVGSVEPGSWVPFSAPNGASLWVTRARDRLGRRARALAPSVEAAAFYNTLAAGLRADLGDLWEERFSKSGLAHVLSVSGLHVAALAVFTLALARLLLVRLWRRRRWLDPRRPAALLSIPALWGYVIFTGNQPPAVRSAVMASAVFLGLALWRRSDALNSLALAALALVCFDPSSVADLSLRLSFGAVASLILLSPAIRESLPVPRPDPQEPRPWRRRLARAREAGLQAFCTSLAATLGSVALIAATFHRVSLAGLVSNLVGLPLCGALTALSAGGAAIFLLAPPLATPVLWSGTRLAQLFLWLVAWFSNLPGAALPAASLPWPAALGLAVGLVAFALGQGRWRWFGLLAPACVTFLFLPPLRTPHQVVVTFLSVGHGDSTVVESEGEAALIDGGGVPGGSDPGKRVVIPYLRERGIHVLALAALSHPHPDHALGLISTLQEIPTRRLWLPAGNDDGPLTAALRQAATGAGAQIETMEVGHPALKVGEVEVSVLGPPQDRVLLEGVNDRSLVLRLTHGAVSFLLTGDIEAAGEEALRASPVTVLKAPHHGSGTSSTPPFIAAVRPRFVVFCVGRYNRFHFPNPQVVERYLQAGSRCFRTDLDGAIRFRSDGRDVQVETFLAPGKAAAGSPVEAAEGHAQL